MVRTFNQTSDVTTFSTPVGVRDDMMNCVFIVVCVCVVVIVIAGRQPKLLLVGDVVLIVIVIVVDFWRAFCSPFIPIASETT